MRWREPVACVSLAPLVCCEGARTFLRGIGLHEALARARLLELGRKPCQLGQVFVDKANFRGEVVVVDVLCEVPSDVA
jgi:hypothetical protein